MAAVLGVAAYRESVPIKAPGRKKDLSSAVFPGSASPQHFWDQRGSPTNADGAQDPSHLEPHLCALRLLAQRGAQSSKLSSCHSLLWVCLSSLLHHYHSQWLSHGEKYQIGVGSQGQPMYHLIKISIPPSASSHK